MLVWKTWPSQKKVEMADWAGEELELVLTAVAWTFSSGKVSTEWIPFTIRDLFS
jgi:hypothetical protein